MGDPNPSTLAEFCTPSLQSAGVWTAQEDLTDLADVLEHCNFFLSTQCCCAHARNEAQQGLTRDGSAGEMCVCSPPTSRAAAMPGPASSAGVSGGSYLNAQSCKLPETALSNPAPMSPSRREGCTVFVNRKFLLRQMPCSFRQLYRPRSWPQGDLLRPGSTHGMRGKCTQSPVTLTFSALRQASPEVSLRLRGQNSYEDTHRRWCHYVLTKHRRVRSYTIYSCQAAELPSS